MEWGNTYDKHRRFDDSENVNIFDVLVIDPLMSSMTNKYSWDLRNKVPQNAASMRQYRRQEPILVYITKIDRK